MGAILKILVGPALPYLAGSVLAVVVCLSGALAYQARVITPGLRSEIRLLEAQKVAFGNAIRVQNDAVAKIAGDCKRQSDEAARAGIEASRRVPIREARSAAELNDWLRGVHR